MTEYASLVVSVDSTQVSAAAAAERDMTAASRGLESATNSQSRAMENATQKQSVFASGVGMIKTQIVGLAATMSVGFFANWIAGAVESADAMSEAAEAAALTTQEYARLNMAIKIGAASGADITTSMKAMNEAISSNNASLASLGINTRNADGSMRSAYDVTIDVARAFEGMTDETQKAAMATDIFGRSGGAMLPLLNKGAEGIKTLGQNAAVASAKLQALAGDNEVQTANLVGVLDTLRNSIAEKVLPRLNDMLEWAVKFGPTLKPVLEVLGFLSGIITGPLTFALKSVMTSLSLVMGALTALGQLVATVAAAMVRLFSGDFPGAVAAVKAGATDMAATVKGTRDQLIALWGDDEKAAGDHAKKMAAALSPVTVPTTPTGTLDASTCKVTTVGGESTDTRLAKELATEAEYAAARKAAALEEADFQTELNTARVKDAARYREEDLAAEQAAQDAKKKMYAEGNSSIGRLLEQAGNKSKSLAKAALVWQKANALAQIAIDTPKAAMAAASAVAMIPLVGPALAGVASAAMYALGGAAAASVMSGGGGGGGAGVSIPNTSTGTGVLSPVGGTVADTGTAPARVAAIDFTITGRGMPSWEQLGEIMNMIGEKMADSGGRMGQVRIVTSDH